MSLPFGSISAGTIRTDLAVSPRLTASRTYRVLRREPAAIRRDERCVPVEMPVAISYNGVGYAVMMASPADLEDFAFGFSRGERIIERAAEVIEIASHATDWGVLLDIRIAPERFAPVLDRIRHRVAESGCGLCGVENLEQAVKPLPRLGVRPGATSGAIFAALGGLRRHQPLNEATGAVHAAAYCRRDGELLAVREDVGRHNALDKLIGHLTRSGSSADDGFILLTSRCSYELIEKTVLLGCPLLVTVSAATSLAVDRAREAGLSLISLARPDAMLVMNDPYALFAESSS